MCSPRNRLTEALSSLEGEVLLRLLLMCLFFVSEEFHPFTRVIHKEEFWLLDNPRTTSYYPTWLLTSSALLVPFATIYMFSFCRMEREEAVKAWLAYTFSALFTATVTNLVKNVVGRPRPDFMHRCFPDGIPDAPFGPDGLTLLCNGDESEIREGRKSFPSGHSSIVFSSIGFLSFYLAQKLQLFGPVRRSEAWRFVTASLPLMFSLMVALSRTCDYHHHWQDVTVGSLLGLAVAFVSFRLYLCKPTFSSSFSSSSSSATSKRDGRKSSSVPHYELLCENCQRQREHLQQHHLSMTMETEMNDESPVTI